jgi:hypothetical protein
VRFLGNDQTLQTELLSGKVISQSAGAPTMIVTTPKYQFAPAQEGECRYLVQLSKDQETVAAAMEGNLQVKSRNAGGSYVLPQGKYVAIPASSEGVPGQAPPAGGRAALPSVGVVRVAIPHDVVKRQGQSQEAPLRVEDVLNPNDVVQSLQDGRLWIALLDGSYLNVGSGSTLKILYNDPQSQQTAIEFASGKMRASVITLTEPGASFKVQTPTGVVGVSGTDFIVATQIDFTGVYCLQGKVIVQNIDPAIPGQVTCYTSEYTSVARGLPPFPCKRTPTLLLQREIDLTQSSSPAGSGAGTPGVIPAAWHIGSLSEAESVGLAAGIAAGAAAAIAIPASSSPASPSAP